MIYPIYYGLNYFLGYFWLWIKKSNGGSLTIFDRYLYEYIIQPAFAKCPRWLLKIIYLLIPKPDILIFLKSSPDSIYSRKRELPLHEIERQLKICEGIVKNKANGFIIINETIEDSVNQIKKIIIDRLKA